MMEVHRQSGGFTPPVEDAAERCPVGQNDRTGVNSFSAYLGAPSDRISDDSLNLLNLGDVILLGFAPWNETCFAKQLAFGSFAIPLAQNLSHRSHAIPLGFTPCNQKHISLGRFQL